MSLECGQIQYSRRRDRRQAVYLADQPVSGFTFSLEQSRLDLPLMIH